MNGDASEGGMISVIDPLLTFHIANKTILFGDLSIEFCLLTNKIIIQMWRLYILASTVVRAALT